MLSIVKSEIFTFVINGQYFESTVAEIVLLSPTIHEILRSNPTHHTFVILNDTIDSSSFNLILQFVHSRDCFDLSNDKTLTVLSLCCLLGNERLVFFLLSSFVAHSKSDISIFTNFCDEFYDLNIDYCSSQFYSYLINQFRCLNKQTLHNILSSHSLQIDIEDVLLNSLIDVRSDYFGCWIYIDVELLSPNGFSIFCLKNAI
jgi:hypothetical protein